MFLIELHSPLEKQDLLKLKRVLSKQLNMKKSEAWDFAAAVHDVGLRGWESSSGKRVRFDLSNLDEESKSLVMRFVLTWYKKIVEEAETKADLARELSYLKDFIKDLKWCKFPAAELDSLNLFKAKAPKEPV